MGSQGPGRKRNPNKNVVTPEEDALTIIAREAESQLAAKRYDRVEAHEVCLRELERQQKKASVDEHMSVERRTSTLDSLAEMEEKYHKAMVSNALLDNEKNSLMFEVDTMKDSLTELEERLAETCREFEEKCKDLEREKQAHSILKFQFSKLKDTLKQSEELLTKHGIVLRPDLSIKWDVGVVTNGSAITEIQQENNTLGTEEEQKGRDENRSAQPRDFDHGLQGNLLPKKPSSFLESSLVAQNEHVGLRHDLNKGLGQIPNSVEKSQKSDTEASRSALELKEEIKTEGTVVLKTPEGIVVELEHISFNKDCVRRDQHESPVYFRHERTKKENTASTNDAHEFSAKDGDHILETVIPNAQAKVISLVSSQIIDSNTPKSQSDNISGKKKKRKKKNKQKQNKSYEKRGDAETGKNNENQQKTVKNNEDSTVFWRMESNSDCNCMLEEASDEAQANEKITTLNNEEKINPVHKALVYAIRQVESVNNQTECPSSSDSTSALKGLPTDDLQTELQSTTNYRKSGNHNLVYTSNTEIKFLSNFDISVNDGLRAQLLNMVANSVDLSASLEVKCEKDVAHAAKYIAEMETAADVFNLDETNTSPETSIGSNLGGMAFKDEQDDIVLPEGIQKIENAKKESALVDQEAKMEENETELYCGNSFEFDVQDLKSSSDLIPKCLPVESDMEGIVPTGTIEDKNECRQTQESVDAFSEQISEPKGLTDASH